MTREEFDNALNTIEQSKEYAEIQVNIWHEEINNLRESERKLYKEYVATCESFPYKVGKWYDYEETRTNKIHTYKLNGKVRLKKVDISSCDLNKITLVFENLVGQKLLFSYVNIDGVFKYNPTAKFVEIDEPTELINKVKLQNKTIAKENE